MSSVTQPAKADLPFRDSIATAPGVPPLIRSTTYNPRGYNVRHSVEAAALLRAMLDGDTQFDRHLASVAGLPDSSSAADCALAARSADVEARWKRTTRRKAMPRTMSARMARLVKSIWAEGTSK